MTSILTNMVHQFFYYITNIIKKLKPHIYANYSLSKKKMAHLDASDPRVGEEIMNINRVHNPFGIQHDNIFTPMYTVSSEIINGKRRLYHVVNGERVLASHFINRIRGYGVRWLNHLCFRDGNGNIQKFKNYVETRHGVVFSS